MMEYYLYTRRLQLLPFIPEDSKMFQDLNNNPYMKKFIWDSQEIDAILSDEIMEQNIRCFEQNRYGLWKICLMESEITIGYVGLWNFFNNSPGQLIYAILEPYAGRGYTTEACIGIIDYTFEKLGFDSLLAVMDATNLFSQKVALRLGMSLKKGKIIDNRPTLFYEMDRKTTPSAKIQYGLAMG